MRNSNCDRKRDRGGNVIAISIAKARTTAEALRFQAWGSGGPPRALS